MYDTKNEHIQQSPLAEYSVATKRGILFEDTKVLASIPVYCAKKMREAIAIFKTEENNFNNEDDSVKIPKTWGQCCGC